MLKRNVIAAFFCFASTAQLTAQTPLQNQATAVYLHALEQTDGGYAPFVQKIAGPKSSLSATTSAIRALTYFSDKPRHPETTAQFVASCFDAATGGFADEPGAAPTTITTAIGIMAVVELKIPLGRYQSRAVRYLSDRAKSLEEIRLAAAAFESLKSAAPRANEWLEQIAHSRNRDSTFGEGSGMPRATGETTALILRLGGTLENRDRVLQVLRTGQRHDGGFGSGDSADSDLGATYRVMRAFTMLKESPADPQKLRAFIASCRNMDGGYGVTPGLSSTASGTYYAGIVLHWIGQQQMNDK